nr:hypothetical protein [Tanacetum cinerariifolium]
MFQAPLCKIFLTLDLYSGIVDKYLDHRMNEVVKVVVQLQLDRLRDEAQAENEDFLNKLDENISKIINEQVKEQVKAQVSKTLPKIKKTINEQLEAEVLTRSSNSSKISHDDKDEEPSAGSNRGSKRKRGGKEPESTSAPKEKTSKTTSKSTEGSKSYHKSTSESAPVEGPMHTTKDLEEPAYQEFDTGANDDQPVAEASQHPDWFQKQAKPLTPDQNEDFLNKLDENISKIINEQVKEQVKAQVSKTLPKIKKTINEQLKAEVLTRSSNSSKISHDVAANLSELELKKILIEKMESNKSIHRSDEQKNLYKALVAYECDKLILDTYGNTVTLKRRRDDEDKDEEPSAGSNRGSKRKWDGKEPESTSDPKEKTSKTTSKSTEGSKSHHKSTSESAPVEEPMHTTKYLEEPAHQEFDTGANDDQHVAEASQHPDWFQKQAKPLTPNPTTDQLDWNNPEGQQYPHDLRTPLPLIPISQGRRIIPFDHFINNDLEYLRGGVSSRKYTTSVTKTDATDYGHIKWIEDLFYGFATNRESARDVYSKRRIIAVTKLQISLYIEMMTSSTNSRKAISKGFAFKTLKIYLQLGVRSYQKKINLTKSDMYRSDLKQKEAYTAYSNPRSFIYQNKDRQNRLMRIDELHKFNDGTLNDVWTALNDRLKGIRMQYLPQTLEMK